MNPPTPKGTIGVHVRLFDVDVKEIKRRAKEKLIPWVQELRSLIHSATFQRERKVR